MAEPRTPSGQGPEDARGRFIETVSDLTRGSIRLAKEEGRAAGVSLPQLFLLGSLHSTGPIPVARWAGMVGATPSATTGLLDGLESEGLLVRHHDAADRRQVLIALSAKGERLAQRIQARMNARWVDLLAGIPDADLAPSAQLLGRICERMGSVLAPEPVEAPRRAARRRSP